MDESAEMVSNDLDKRLRRLGIPFKDEKSIKMLKGNILSFSHVYQSSVAFGLYLG